MKSTFKLLATVLFSGLVMISCNSTPKEESSEEITCPNITAQGVDPFLLGASMKSIPFNGGYYDTIIYKLRYSVKGVMDGENWEWDEEQMKEYKNSSYYGDFTIEDSHADCYIVSCGDTLMIVKCNSDGQILTVKILSDKLQFENGIHIGLSSSEMYSNHNAKFITTIDNSVLGGEDTVEMGYVIPNLQNTVSLIAAKRNNITFGDSEEMPDYPMFPVHGEKTNISGVYAMPLDDVKDDYLKNIVITSNGYPRLYGRW